MALKLRAMVPAKEENVLEHRAGDIVVTDLAQETENTVTGHDHIHVSVTMSVIAVKGNVELQIVLQSVIETTRDHTAVSENTTGLVNETERETETVKGIMMSVTGNVMQEGSGLKNVQFVNALRNAAQGKMLENLLENVNVSVIGIVTEKESVNVTLEQEKRGNHHRTAPPDTKDLPPVSLICSDVAFFRILHFSLFKVLLYL